MTAGTAVRALEGLEPKIKETIATAIETAESVVAADIALATGSIFVGAAGIASALDAKTSGQILVGSGTTVASVAVSGHATLASTGALTIAAGVLAADAGGRARMATGFFDAATVLDKFGANSFDATNVDDAFATGSIGEDRLTAAELTGRVMAAVANVNVIGGVPVVHRITIATGNPTTVDTVLTHKTRIHKVWAVKTSTAGGAADTVQVLNSANAITDAMSLLLADKLTVAAASYDDAFWEIAAGGTLRVTGTAATTDCACEVIVEGIRVA